MQAHITKKNKKKNTLNTERVLFILVIIIVCQQSYIFCCKFVEMFEAGRTSSSSAASSV